MALTVTTICPIKILYCCSMMVQQLQKFAIVAFLLTSHLNNPFHTTATYSRSSLVYALQSIQVSSVTHFYQDNIRAASSGAFFEEILCCNSRNSFRYQQKRKHQLPSPLYFSLDQDETTNESDVKTRFDIQDTIDFQKMENDEVPVYQNVVAKFLSFFMQSSTSDILDSDVLGNHSDDNNFKRRRSDMMKEVLIQQESDEYWDQPKISSVLPLHILAEALDYEIYHKEWFVTGYVNPIYFSSTDFTFQDPDVKINSIQSYCTGVRRIFDYNNTARAEVLSTVVNPNCTNVITCTWRLSGKVNIGPAGLTIKPYIVTTDYTIDETTGLIVYQVDRFTIPSWDILLSALFPFLIDTGIVSAPAPKPLPRNLRMPDLSKYML